MFKKTLIATALLAGSSAALAEISGNVNLATDYVFRGWSQTIYGGFSGELANGVGYDLGYIRYEYPGYGDADTNEVYLGGSFSNFSAKLVYSDELAFIGSKESAWYLAGGYEMELPEGFGLSASLGYSFGDAFDNDVFSDSYLDWSIGVTKSVGGVDLGLTYTDVDLDSADDCNSDICDTKFVFSIGKSL
jgi:uncharacterized protein (TIGR02001 family)